MNGKFQEEDRFLFLSTWIAINNAVGESMLLQDFTALNASQEKIVESIQSSYQFCYQIFHFLIIISQKNKIEKNHWKKWQKDSHIGKEEFCIIELEYSASRTLIVCKISNPQTIRRLHRRSIHLNCSEWQKMELTTTNCLHSGSRSRSMKAAKKKSRKEKNV